MKSIRMFAIASVMTAITAASGQAPAPAAPTPATPGSDPGKHGWPSDSSAETNTIPLAAARSSKGVKRGA